MVIKLYITSPISATGRDVGPPLLFHIYIESLDSLAREEKEYTQIRKEEENFPYSKAKYLILNKNLKIAIWTNK